MWGHLWKDLPCLRSVVFLPCSTQLPKSEVPRRPRKDMWKAHQLKSQWPSTQLINQSPTLRYMSQQILFLHLENECNMDWKSLKRPFRIQDYGITSAWLTFSTRDTILQGHSRISYHWRLYFPSKSYLLHQKNLSATQTLTFHEIMIGKNYRDACNVSWQLGLLPTSSLTLTKIQALRV